MAERTDWHPIFQGMLENLENLRELSGKIIAAKAREYEQQIKIDFVVHTEGNVPSDNLKPIVRPFSHFKKRNLLEYKTTWEVLNEKMFRRYVGRTLDGETTDDVDYQNETTLTIITLHKPEQLLSKKEYKIERVTDWKYQSYLIPHLDIIILVQREMRGLKEGEAMALLQVIESEKEKQKQVWETLFDQDLENLGKLKKIVEKISGGIFMNVIQEAKTEGKKDVAIEMLNKGMEISLIVELTKLPENEVQKLKKELEEKEGFANS